MELSSIGTLLLEYLILEAAKKIIFQTKPSEDAVSGDKSNKLESTWVWQK